LLSNESIVGFNLWRETLVANSNACSVFQGRNNFSSKYLYISKAQDWINLLTALEYFEKLFHSFSLKY